MPAQIPDGELTDVAVDARGWIAVGRSGLPATGGVLVMTSPDGRTWTAADPASFAKAELNGASVAVGPTSRVIMGQGGYGGTAVWRAGLDGRWVKAALPQGTEAYVDDVAFGHGRFVAVGASGPMGQVGAAWESADGLTWRAARPFPGRAVGAIAGVASTAGGFLAAGAVADGAAVWSSADGITWSRPTLLPGGNTTTAGALAVGPGGIVIAAGFPPGVTWTSTDGTTWRKEAVPDADSGVFGVAALRAGFILAGGLSQGLDLGFFATRTTISSPWQAFPPLLDFRQAFPGRLVAAPDGSLVVGVGSDRDRQPAIFVSPPR